MKLEWSAAALAYLDRFAAFLHDRHPQLAKTIADQIRQRTSLLEEYPLIGRAIEGRPHFRELVLEVANATYIFWYACDDEQLVMLRVFHSREARE
jgi:plasmid stabilization system protein ParE